MESVQKAVRDAAEGLRNLAFGEQQVTESAAQHGEEPVSGVQGRGTATDPYDAGNRDEQPGAPQTQDNTAVIPEPLESITPIEVKPTDVSSANSTSDQGAGAGAGAGATAALPLVPEPSPAPVQEQSQPETPNTNLEPGPGNPAVDEPSPAQEQSNPTESTADTAASSTSSSSSNPAEHEKPASEQRSQTMPEGDSSSSSSSEKKEDGGVPGGVERAPPTTTQQVSVEALKGPQGPPPGDAYEFEKEMDGQGSKTKTGDQEGDKGDTGNHHHKMGHMKERLGKVFKHGNR